MLSWSQIVDACRYCHIIQVHKTLLQLMSKWNIQLQTTANTTKTSFLNPKSFFFKSKSRQQKGQAVTDSDSIMCELIAKTISLNGYAHLRKSQLTSKFHLHIAPHASLQDNLSHCCTCSIPCTWIKWVYWHQKKDEYIYIYIYRGCGEPLIGFWPYFLHEYSSGGISAILLLIAGTLIDLFTLCFL